MNNTYPSHHPASDMLRSYCAGELDDVVGIMVAAHVNLCPECKQQATHIDGELAARALQLSRPEQSPVLDISSMLDKATAEPATSISNASVTGNVSVAGSAPVVGNTHVMGNARVLNDDSPDQIRVSIRDREIPVPPVLSGIVKRCGPWNHVVNELWQSPVKGHGHAYQVDFIYMYPGGTVPSHTHKGREITLVLDGSFSDSDGEYCAGDFMIKTSQDEHNPVSESGCLCLAAIDAPLHFTSGISRLINPFSQLFFRSEA